MSEIKQPDASTPPGFYVNPQGLGQWWDGQAWTPAMMPQVQKPGTNHVFHLLMSVLTLGLWIPVWIIVAISNASK